MDNQLTLLAVIYGIMWLLSFFIHNLIYSLVVSGFAVVLIVIFAISIDGMDDENMRDKAHLEVEIEKLRKEIDQLKGNERTT